MTSEQMANLAGVEADRAGMRGDALHIDFDELPTLYRDRSFWGMTVTQFLGAFNDNLFKQLMLLLALKVAAQDLQWLAMIVFSVPFVVFSGYAGYLSDRTSKRPIIVASKVAEIAVMALGLAGFLLFGWFGFAGLLVVLFLMGTQSAFFGPGKYGVLPEMLRPRDLPRANGVIVMTTFLAIIFGTACAGLLTDPFLKPGAAMADVAPQLWRGSLVCIFIAIAGTLTSLLIRRTPPACPNIKLLWSSLTVPPDTRKLLRHDRRLLVALLATCAFWMVAGVTQQAVNSLGKTQLLLSDFATSVMAASIGVGIAVGAVIAGRLCHGRPDFRVCRAGAVGCVIFLAVLSQPGPIHGHLLGFGGSLCGLMLLGVSAGFFAIPLQTFIQSRPPNQQKGRIIAVMNQANFIAILLSGVLYLVFDRVVEGAGLTRAMIFWFTALLMLPVALFYRPRNEESAEENWLE